MKEKQEVSKKIEWGWKKVFKYIRPEKFSNLTKLKYSRS